MSNIKSNFLSIVGRTVSVLPTPLLFSLSRQNSILPFYHAITDQPLPHIKNLYAVKSSKQFVSDLDFLLQHFEPVDFTTFIERKATPNKKFKPYFLLSFDDGLREFGEIIAPTLIQKGIPAVCFLNSDFVDNKALFFRYKVSLLIEEVQRNNSNKNAAVDFFQTPDVISRLLNIKHHEQEQLNQFAAFIGFSFNDFLQQEQPYLTSSTIQALAKQGFCFGAHSTNHPEYQYIPQEDQLEQTTESLNFLNRLLPEMQPSFSFPFTDFGVTGSFFENLHQAFPSITTFGTAGIKKELTQNHFQRIPFEAKKLSSKQILNSELFYFLLKTMVNKNTIQRPYEN